MIVVQSMTRHHWDNSASCWCRPHVSEDGTVYHKHVDLQIDVALRMSVYSDVQGSCTC